MNTLRQAAQQALEALEAMQSYAAAERKGLRICDESIIALRTALEQEQEPVAVHQWREQGCADWYDGHPDYCDSGGPYETRTLYTTPPTLSTSRSRGSSGLYESIT